MNKTFWAIVAVIVVIFGGILLLKGNHNNTTQSTSRANPTSHIVGKGTSGVTLVEYGDYQCPYCGLYYQTVKDVQSKYGDQIKFQFRNLPLLQIHQNAFAAARAAEAAANQGKFWEMHDLLYTNQTAWAQSPNPTNTFQEYAGQLGLNVTKFKQDAGSRAVNDTINADIAAFNKTNEAMSTPTFFLDGKKISPANSVDDFTKLIDAEIAKKKTS